MTESIDRRQALGLGAGAALLGLTSNLSGNIRTPPMSYPWKYLKLNKKKTRARAYQKYFEGGCMYAVVEAIAGQVAEKLGEPYTQFPFGMSSYGGGGISGWGTLCGTCNGAAMAISLFHQGTLRHQLINELFTWYEDQELPTFLPPSPRMVNPEYKLTKSRAKSTLCHLSIIRWTKKSKEKPFGPGRIERCARIAADVAGMTAQLLNRATQQKFTPGDQIGSVANGCLKCHSQGKKVPNEPDVVSKMNCTVCHTKAHHQKKNLKGNR